MNIFQSSYIERLSSWSNLRANTISKSCDVKCKEIDNWWQQAPLVKRHLDHYNINNWPDPWELLHENKYCLMARALGIAYSLYMIDIKKFDMCEASDEYGDDVIIVVCDRYVMNWHPNTTLCNKISDFNIKNKINISSLLQKIQ